MKNQFLLICGLIMNRGFILILKYKLRINSSHYLFRGYILSIRGIPLNGKKVYDHKYLIIIKKATIMVS
jgi:hypothetical protein